MACMIGGNAQALASRAAAPASRERRIGGTRGASSVCAEARNNANGVKKTTSGVGRAAWRRSLRSGGRGGIGSPRAAIASGPSEAAATATAATAFEGSAARGRPRVNHQADEFRTLAAEGHNLIPLYRRIFDDQLTPILAYRCLVKEDERDAPSFLLESVVGGTQTGRYSFLGSRPYMEVRALACNASAGRASPPAVHLGPPRAQNPER